MIFVDLPVDNPAELLSSTMPNGFGPGAVIRVESSTDNAIWNELGTVALVAEQTYYAFGDPNGDTSTYYRTRYSKGAPGVLADYSGYSPVFQAGSLTAYATLDDLKEGMTLPDDTKNNYLGDLLRDASAYIDQECGRTFYRDPQISGTSSWTFDVRYPGQTRLSSALGFSLDLVQVDQLQVAWNTGASFDTVTQGQTGYYLELANPQAGWPFEDIVWSDYASQFYVWPFGRGTVRISGVRGFPSIPPMVKRATLDLAREWYRQGPGGGAPVGVNQYGTPMFASGLPHSVLTVIDPGGPYVRNSYVAV